MAATPSATVDPLDPQTPLLEDLILAAYPKSSPIHVVSMLRSCWQQVHHDASWPSAFTGLLQLLNEVLSAKDVALLPQQCDTILQAVQHIQTQIKRLPVCDHFPCGFVLLC